MPPNSTPHARSKPWSKSRLRPAPIQHDPLEAAGLPSKGDTTLLNLKAQDDYFTILEQRYMAWCAATGAQCVSAMLSRPQQQQQQAKSSIDTGVTDLDISQSFTNMSLDGPSYIADIPMPSQQQGRTKVAATSASASTSASARPSTTATTIKNPDKELAIIHLSMRKLREAILSTSRRDDTACTIYTFIIRASMLTRTFESYHPALLHLLYGLHAVAPLSSSMLHEFIAYQILDMACRLGDYGEAIALRARWGFRDRSVDDILKALVRGDWVTFWRIREGVDGYQKALMGCAEERVRKHVLKCVGKAYLSVSKTYVQRAAGGRSWEELVAKDGVGWEEDAGIVTVRRVKPVSKSKG